MNYVKKLRALNGLQLEADMAIAASRNQLELTSLLKEIEALNAQGMKNTYLFLTKGRWETLAELLAMGAQLRTEGFMVLVQRDLYSRVYLNVKW